MKKSGADSGAKENTRAWVQSCFKNISNKHMQFVTGENTVIEDKGTVIEEKEEQM